MYKDRNCTCPVLPKKPSFMQVKSLAFSSGNNLLGLGYTPNDAGVVAGNVVLLNDYIEKCEAARLEKR